MREQRRRNDEGKTKRVEGTVALGARFHVAAAVRGSAVARRGRWEGERAPSRLLAPLTPAAEEAPADARPRDPSSTSLLPELHPRCGKEGRNRTQSLLRPLEPALLIFNRYSINSRHLLLQPATEESAFVSPRSLSAALRIRAAAQSCAEERSPAGSGVAVFRERSRAAGVRVALQR